MNIALDLDSFSMSEFCLHQLDILPKHSRRSEQVKEPEVCYTLIILGRDMIESYTQ